MRRRRTVRRWRSRQPGTAAVVRRPDCILLGEVRGGETSNCSRTIGAMNGLVAPVDAIPVMRSRPPTQWRRVAAISYHVFAIWRRNVRRSTRSQTVSACWRGVPSAGELRTRTPWTVGPLTDGRTIGRTPNCYEDHRSKKLQKELRLMRVGMPCAAAVLMAGGQMPTGQAPAREATKPVTTGHNICPVGDPVRRVPGRVSSSRAPGS